MLRGTLNLADLRQRYVNGVMQEADLAEDGRVQLERWLADAVEEGVMEANAMALSTCGRDGWPSVRMVLLKGFDMRGLQFFTNLVSRKARELQENPRASVLFFWPEMERQVSVRGWIRSVPRAEVEAYFVSRPYESQVGAWVSTQSEVIPDRGWLEARDEEYRKKFPEGGVPAPEFWGGFCLEPDELEFWQGRPGRLHDRFRYRRDGEVWLRERLSP